MTHLVDWQEPFPPSVRGGCVAIGNFDGVHVGHARLIADLAEQARGQGGGPAVAMIFEPHPLEVLRPGVRVELLTSPAARAGYLREAGADYVLSLRATPGLLALSAPVFFEEVVRGRLAARGMVEGTNFCFGRNREGDVTLLRTLCQGAGMVLQIVPPQRVDGVEVSSSQIRADLARGDVARAGRLLGRRYRLQGVVGQGARRGRTIGFPTANLERVATVVPAFGVYAVRAWTAGGEGYAAAANVGPNPTFGEEAVKIEVHLLGYQGDLYGQELQVEFVARLRDTRPFGSVTELIEQLRRDVEQARVMVGAIS